MSAHHPPAQAVPSSTTAASPAPGAGTVTAVCRSFAEDFPGGLGALHEALSRRGLTTGTHGRVDGRFPDGELCVDLPGDPTGAHVIIHQSLTGPAEQVDQSAMALLAVARAYREHGARRVTAVVPHLAYARHDRHVPGERRPIMAGLLAQLAATAGIDQLITLASGAQDRLGRLGEPMDLVQLPPDEALVSLVHPWVVPGRTVLVAPDAGAADQVRRLGDRLRLPVITATKRRTGPDSVTATLTSPAPGPADRAIIVDDLITSAGTMLAVARLARAEFDGCQVLCAATHLRPTPTGEQRLAAALRDGTLHRVLTTDAAGHRPRIPGVDITAVLPLIADAVAEQVLPAHSPLAERPTAHAGSH
ncbi:ribose-phosphate diphosphokinase [Streptomyces decoyicus]|uniref:ribose-phosphate diphosphokinase n=1 Tax=Streptomyces decoyicus TaxID=249567 RepID=UPI002E3326A4|nr:ribose-phosphate diphosphokinase [Streptomyces decoyicus]